MQIARCEGLWPMHQVQVSSTRWRLPSVSPYRGAALRSHDQRRSLEQLLCFRPRRGRQPLSPVVPAHHPPVTLAPSWWVTRCLLSCGFLSIFGRTTPPPSMDSYGVRMLIVRVRVRKSGGWISAVSPSICCLPSQQDANPVHFLPFVDLLPHGSLPL